MGSLLDVLLWSLFLVSIQVLVQGNDDCPKPCFCTKAKYGRKVSCSARGITNLNIRSIPEDTVEIDLSANEIQAIRQDSFLIPEKNKVKKLILRSNKIRLIQPGSFRRFPRLNKLYLEENGLLKIERDTFRGLRRLKHLNVSTNQLMYIEANAFKHMNSLRKLSLSNNKLVTLTPEPFVNITVKNLQLDGNPLICDCGLNWLRDWIKRKEVSVSQSSKCEYPKRLKGRKLSILLDHSWDCGKYPFEIPLFQVRPLVDQVAFQSDSLSLHCSTLWHPAARLVWYKNGKKIALQPNHTTMEERSDLHGRMNHSVLVFRSLNPIDSGDYTCHVQMKESGKLQRRVNLRVLSNELKYCKLDVKKTNRGVFVWHNTAAGGSSVLPCQFGAIYPNAAAKRNCSKSGEWTVMENKHCLHKKKITRDLEILNSYAMNQSNVVQSARILYSLSKNFTEQITTIQEIKYIINILNSTAKFGYYSDNLRKDVLRILNVLMAMSVKLLRRAQFERQLSTRLLEIVPVTAKSTLDKKTNFDPIITSNIGTHVWSFQPRDYRGLSCLVRFPRGSRKVPVLGSGEVYCSDSTNPAKLVKALDGVVNFSPELLSITKRKKLHRHRKWVNVTFVAYKTSTFFIETIPLAVLSQNENSVIASVIIGLHIQVPGVPPYGMIESVTFITFRNTKVGKNPRLVFWAKDRNHKKTGWLQMTHCVLSGANEIFTQFNCSRIPGRMLYLATVMDVEEPAQRSVFQPGIFVFIGSGICSAALMLALMTYAGIRDLRYNRNDAAATMNLCLALLVSILVFASGINQVQNQLLCKALAVLLHYFLLCALLWLGCGGLCLQSLVVKVKINEEYNPVLKYYLIGWGLPLIICGITLAGNSKNYTTEDYCWLYPTASLAAFIGPGALLLLVDLGIYIRLHTAINRRFPEMGTDNPTTHAENKIRKSRGGSVAAVSEAGDFKFPKKSELLDILRGSLALMLWFCGNVTFAVMMLAYRNRPSSVLFNLFSYGYSIGTIFLGLTVLFFFCLRQEAVQLVLKEFCWTSKRAKGTDHSTREDVLLLPNSPCTVNDTLPKQQDQLALMTANARDQSDIVSGISGPPSVFTDAVSSRPSSILGPVTPFNFEQNAEKIKELAPVSERDITENEGRSMQSHDSARNLSQRGIDRKDIKSDAPSDRVRPSRLEDPRGAPIASGDYSTSTLQRNLSSNCQETPNPTIIKPEQAFSDLSRTFSDSKCPDMMDQRAEQVTGLKPPSSVTGKASTGPAVELPTSLKSFVPPNWKPARRGGSGVSYYPYFDHNFHRIPKRAPSSQGSAGPSQSSLPRPVPIPARGDVQGGPATTLSLAIQSHLPLLCNREDQPDSSLIRGPPIGQAAVTNTQIPTVSIGNNYVSDSTNFIPVSTPFTVQKENGPLDPSLVPSHEQNTFYPIDTRFHNSLEFKDLSMHTEKPRDSSYATAPDEAVLETEETQNREDPSNYNTEQPADYFKICSTNTTSDQTEDVQSPAAETLSPTASSQQSDMKGSRERHRSSSSQAQMSRRHRKRRRRKRPSSIAFDDIAVPKTIIYIPLPHVIEQHVQVREETSV